MTELQRALKLTEEIQRDYVDVAPVQALRDILETLILKDEALRCTLREYLAQSQDPMVDVRFVLRLVE